MKWGALTKVMVAKQQKIKHLCSHYSKSSRLNPICIKQCDNDMTTHGTDFKIMWTVAGSMLHTLSIKPHVKQALNSLPWTCIASTRNQPLYQNVWQTAYLDFSLEMHVVRLSVVNVCILESILERLFIVSHGSQLVFIHIEHISQGTVIQLKQRN